MHFILVNFHSANMYKRKRIVGIMFHGYSNGWDFKIGNIGLLIWVVLDIICKAQYDHNKNWHLAITATIKDGLCISRRSKWIGRRRGNTAVYMNNCKKNDVTFMDIVQLQFIIRKWLLHVTNTYCKFSLMFVI